MSAHFEEIDRRQTSMGEITVRRRREPTLDIDVYEVKLGDEFLMSSLFTVAEIALATLALAHLPGADLDVVVGGLGLGYTARAVLADPRVRSVHVVEALAEVIEWQERGLLPFAAELTEDPRCHLVRADFFALVEGGDGFGAMAPVQCDAVLVDIDHSPRHLLAPHHGAFYTVEGLRRVRDRVVSGGIFGLWADGAPDDEFCARLGSVFSSAVANTVRFPNFYTGSESSSTVYIARAAS